MRFRDRRGTYRRFEIRGRAAVDVRGVDGIVLILRDVTERRRWEVGQGKGSTLQAIIDHAPAITMLLDGDGALRSASRAFTNLLGHDLEGALGEHLATFADPSDAERVRAELSAAAAESIPVTFEAAFRHVPSGLSVPLSLTVVNLLDDHAVEGLVVTAVDITQLAETRARLQHLATHDGLTGLPNRALFIDRLEHALAVARRRGTEVVLIYGDVDQFKQVNDEHGHLSGDAVLVEVAARIRGAIRESDTVARIGGDEFVVLLEDDDPITTRDRIAAALAPPVELPDGRSVTVRLSCGVTTSAGHADMASLLAAADAAMYRTKQR
jgi:diguanylate cyclase (GGDEF)-like protein/PAS domain S-box-containing protein